ncbi:hypothetical protein COX00_00805 [Candidatus Uhrbacteria bacterium CG22_combo_CG10-13_8_21_14_all_47_17]|uniref:CDP-alcohol phosphatidyltransferase n=1 Tax=Candidatus Uhrbacteria bacterium CG22_combo_CG10-13_8_21_14_all_47_17 TaxID=1975041 RepID=A0A2H0BTK9_9BACT|nr:MAG: hypothetical protein COX00_00805 [Candidatus Uhrbacteria bacterium CG22_combo_CG10-13_8_21_14_all_47_17]
MPALEKLSIKELRARGQSSAPEAGRDPYVGLTIRFFSIYITKLLLRTRVTPNVVTAISVLVFLTGVTLFSWNDPALSFFGGLIVYLSVVLDGCDGEIARIRGPKSRNGALFVEPISHDFQYALMYIPITFGAFLGGGGIAVVFAGVLAIVSKLLTRLMSVRFSQVLFWKKMEEEGFVFQEEAHRMPFNPDVPLYHKLYRWMNRNVFSSVGLVVPLTILGYFQRLDIFVYGFCLFYLFVFLATFLKQARQISFMTRELQKKEQAVYES